MAYVKTQDGQVTQFPYTMGQFRSDNPRTSFPRQIPTETLENYGVFAVDIPAAPTVDAKTQKSIRAEMPTLVSGIWTLTWSIDTKTAQEQQEYTDGISARVRAQRNSLLSTTDWTACSDVTMPEAMTTYRQALRDITAQDGFPWTVEWPTQPE